MENLIAIKRLKRVLMTTIMNSAKYFFLTHFMDSSRSSTARANKQTLRIPKIPKMESTLKTALLQDGKDHLTVYHALFRAKQEDL
ncbi:hypothetical protein BG000_009815 [Podila horticola]|nr:hypothetical protein BG000_009815 [Podila horticola]